MNKGIQGVALMFLGLALVAGGCSGSDKAETTVKEKESMERQTAVQAESSRQLQEAAAKLEEEAARIKEQAAEKVDEMKEQAVAAAKDYADQAAEAVQEKIPVEYQQATDGMVKTMEEAVQEKASKGGFKIPSMK